MTAAAWAAAGAAMAAAALLAWLAQRVMVDAAARYRAAFAEHARLRMGELFLFVDIHQLWAASLAFACACALLAGLAWQSWPAAAAGLAAGLACPARASAWLRRRRMRRFDAQLPDALMALGGALRAGAGLQSALRQLVIESPAPLAQELGLVLAEQRLGVTLDDALCHLFERLPTETCNLVVSALRIATDTGGSLAETLERIAATVRARLHMEGRIGALTAQGRLQARVVGALPPLMAWVLYELEPDAMRPLFTTPAGWAVIAAVAALETLGLWMIGRIVRIEV
ncbi:type II secretion system F family protein [Pigmentiphaga soli]|uniref:Type II secretion system F family protein n=1 Tax=Pigmentiphaga soli TaxID=1007095 RepID=A0ABP8H9X0_9BURK